jgi:hypothetical protein
VTTAPDAPGSTRSQSDVDLTAGPAGTGPVGTGPGAIGHVEAALAALADVADRPPQEQVEPLARAQAALAETLDSVGDI